MSEQSSPRARRWIAIGASAVAGFVVASVGGFFLFSDRAPADGALPTGMAIFPWFMSFPDPQYGMLLAHPCESRKCTPWLVSTSDGGVTWLGWELPADAPSSGNLRVFDRNRAVYGSPEGGVATQWFTADAGRTWRTTTRTPAVTITELPPLAQITVWEEPGLLVYLPDGTTAKMDVPIPADWSGTTSEARLASDGSGWITVGTTGTPQVLSTRDRGQTWVPLSVPAELPPSGRIVTGDGQNLYAITRYAPRPPEPIVYPIWHSNDNGATWRRIPAPFPPVQDIGRIVPFTPPSGELILAKQYEGIWYRPAPGASAFGPAEPGRARKLSGARYFTGAGNEFEPLMPPIYHSPDGQAWTEIKLP